MFIVFTFFFLGLLIGSFCNVLVFRFKKSMSIIYPSSHCFSCKKKISWRDNIPLLSFFILRGKCCKCKTKISWQYPVVEFLVGLTWGFLAFLYDENYIYKTSLLVLWCVIFSALWVILIYDWKYMEIPMGVMYTALFLVIVLNFFAEDWYFIKLTFFSSFFFKKILAGLVSFSFFFSLSFISNEEWMGYGDSFLALFIGLALGGLSFFSILTSFCIGAICSLFIIFLGKAGLKSQVPFGPFLILGFFITFFINYFFPEILNIFS